MDGPNRAARVLRIITRLNIGGPSYQAIGLTRRLQDGEFVSHLVAGTPAPDEGSLEDLAAEQGVTPERLPGLKREIRPARDVLTLFALYACIRRRRPAIVHTHLTKAGALGRLAARLARTPVVVHTFHGHVLRGYFGPARSRLYARIEQALARRTDALIVLGEAQRVELLGLGVGRREQYRCIPLGLELGSFLESGRRRGELRAILGVPEGVPLLGAVARLVPIKDHFTLLAALERLTTRMSRRVDLLLAGDGPLRAEIEARAHEHGFRVVAGKHGAAGADDLRPTVYMPGFLRDLPALYADLDALVLSSRNEGLPVAVIEALACSRPVVATDVGAVRDLVLEGETGLLTPPADPEAIASALERCLRSPGEAEEMGRRGRERVYPWLSADRLEADIRSLYRQLLAEHSGWS